MRFVAWGRRGRCPSDAYRVPPQSTLRGRDVPSARRALGQRGVPPQGTLCGREVPPQGALCGRDVPPQSTLCGRDVPSARRALGQRGVPPQGTLFGRDVPPQGTLNPPLTFLRPTGKVVTIPINKDDVPELGAAQVDYTVMELEPLQ